MRTSFLWIFLLACLLSTLSSEAQSSRIKKLEKKATEQKGIDLIESNIQLSEWYLQEAYVVESMERAAAAGKIARRKREKKLYAVALNREAQALIKLDTPESKRTAQRRLQKSIQVLDKATQNALQQKNLRLLKELTQTKNNTSSPTSSQSPLVKTPPSERVEKLFKDRKNKLDKVEVLKFEKSLLTAEKENLMDLVQRKEQKLESMNQEQMKTELLVMEHKNALDSFRYNTIIDSIQLAQKTMEIREQEAELNLIRSRRNFWIAVGFGGLILAVATFLRYIGVKRYNHVLEEKNTLIAKEKKRSEELLLNILPPSIAAELKEYGVAKAKFFPQATVLFTDFKNFTAIAEQLSPQELVEELNYCFKKFDQIIGIYGLEKIKTIGDAYMCVGGLPETSEGHALKTVQAAQAIQDFLYQWKKEKLEKEEVFFEARIGIHTGPLVAGVVGEKKFAYDVWGDTVNIAARMEASSQAGQINISSNTYELIKNDISCTHRGKIPAKNKGNIDMYFVG